VKIVDKDHHTLEWYEDRGGREPKTTEINYNAQEIWRAIPEGTVVEIRP
jgi:hypothetical protein